MYSRIQAICAPVCGLLLMSLPAGLAGDTGVGILSPVNAIVCPGMCVFSGVAGSGRRLQREVCTEAR